MVAYNSLAAFFLFLCNGILFTAQYWFISFYTKEKQKKTIYPLYLLFSFILMYLLNLNYNPSVLILFFSAVLTALFIKVMLKQEWTLSIILGFLICTIKELSLGVLAPIQHLITNEEMSVVKYNIFFIIVSFIIVVISSFFYWFITKKINQLTLHLNQYFIFILLPIIWVFLILKISEESNFWNATVYYTENSIKSISSVSFKQEFLVMMESLIALCCIISTLLAFQSIVKHFEDEKKRAVWKQLLYSQEKYVEEAKIRLSKTNSIRHDFQNHLAVINKLLENKEIKEAREYLDKISEVTSNLSFICSTQNTVMDALLCNKLSIAKQLDIFVECDVHLPGILSVDNFDLSIIFSNAIDNAITACRMLDKEQRYIKLFTKLEGNFFMIEVTNSCHPHRRSKRGSGIGIPNIEEAAEKYNGAVMTEKGEDFFRLNVLLILSEHINNISEQLY